MTNLPKIVYRLRKAAGDNSPTILTAMGIAGTISTAFLAAQAGSLASQKLARENEHRAIRDQDPLDRKEQFVIVWKFYIPTALNVTGTIVAIYGANRIGSHRTAAMAAAYTMSERAFVEYKDKVVEKVGENKEREYRDEIVQERLEANPVGNREVFILGSGGQLCYESITGRYFESDIESLKAAQNYVNHRIIAHDYATLTEFYNKVGLSPTRFSDEVGWSVSELLELEFTAGLTEEMRPCLNIEYNVEPIRNYHPLR